MVQVGVLQEGVAIDSIAKHGQADEGGGRAYGKLRCAATRPHGIKEAGEAQPWVWRGGGAGRLSVTPRTYSRQALLALRHGR